MIGHVGKIKRNIHQNAKIALHSYVTALFLISSDKDPGKRG
jgi:hypothetical protein